jgi:hypothetical protein
MNVEAGYDYQICVNKMAIHMERNKENIMEVEA